MKNLKYLLAIMFYMTFALSAIAQSPELFKYQAAARSNSGIVMSNQNVSVRATIRKNGLNGQIIYQESHSATTNNFGLFSLTIGGGSINQGTFSAIDWSNGIYFMQIELDANGGTSYTNMGTTQLLSVPFALFAKDVANKDDADANPTNEIQTITKSGNQVTLSNNGGSFTDEINDADASPTNEIQTISKSGNQVTLSNSGGSFTDEINDADASPNNEIQTISKSGNQVTLSNSGGSFTDEVNDADASPTNEIQTLSISNNQLTLSSSGGTITLPTVWSKSGNNAYYNGGLVGIGTNAPSSILQIGNGTNNSTLRLTGNGTNLSKARLNFGSGENVYLEEDIDNTLSLYANEVIIDSDTVHIGSNSYQPGSFNGTLNVESSLYLKNSSGEVKAASVIFDDEGGIFLLGANNSVNAQIASYGKNYGAISVNDSSSLTKGILYVDEATESGRLEISAGTLSSNYSDRVILEVDPLTSNGKMSLYNANNGLESYFSEGELRMNNTNISSYIKTQLTRDDFNIFSSSGAYSVSMYNSIFNQTGNLFIYSPTSANVYLGNSGSNINHGQLELKNSSSFTRAYASVLNSGEGYLELYGPNGNGNIRLTTLSGNNNNGYLAVMDGSGNTQAGIYVNSSGDGIVFGDQKNFRMPHPTQPDKEIWYGSLEGPELAAYMRGTATLINGEVTIDFPEHYEIVANPKTMTVILTPLSANSKGLAVIEKTATGFKVKELANGTGNYELDWEVKCVRKGYESYQPVRDADEMLGSKVEQKDINTANERENPNTLIEKTTKKSPKRKAEKYLNLFAPKK